VQTQLDGITVQVQIKNRQLYSISGVLAYLLAALSSVFRAEVMSQSRKQTPSDFLKQIIGRPVVVKLNSGTDYRGLPLPITLTALLPLGRFRSL